MGRVRVIMNYDGNKEEIVEVSNEATNSDINNLLRKKFGIYDILRWERINEPQTTPTQTVEVVEEVEVEEPLF